VIGPYVAEIMLICGKLKFLADALQFAVTVLS
jgi:hypothetical protein